MKKLATLVALVGAEPPRAGACGVYLFTSDEPGGKRSAEFHACVERAPAPGRGNVVLRLWSGDSLEARVEVDPRLFAQPGGALVDYVRSVELKKRDLIAGAAVDQAGAMLNQAKASTKAQEAQLLELTHGTRPEQIDQAHAAVAAAKGTLEQLELTRARLTVRAPRAGRVDALPFHQGDQPPVGAALVSMLVGDAPYARIFVPAPRRGDIKQGDVFDVKIEDGRTFRASVRSIRSEASFTPYYALAGDDAARLVYRAELVLQGDGAADLPAGLPVSAYVNAP
jgi:hypothetical protein